jgi:fermentation-respiration switch protein FrsA (DUF1100 family)
MLASRPGRLARMYEPGAWIARVSPTPLLMIVALADYITLTDLQLSAYELALEPNRSPPRARVDSERKG